MLNGRIDRKTFVIGNIIALGILALLTIIIMLPLAILEIVINNKTADSFLNMGFYILALPAVAYFFYICVLIIKRTHDFNWPGLLISISFVMVIVLAKLLDIGYFNLLAFLLLVFLTFIPGNKTRNRFGSVPRPRFRFSNLIINV